MNQCTELYAWIRFSFNDGRFSIDDFRAIFPTSQAPKVIHDLVKEGYLRRVERGVYRAVRPKSLIESIVHRSCETKDIVRESKRTYAYCDSTAVAIWTDGYYGASFTKGFKPLHIKVLKKDLSSWKRFFEERRVRYVLLDENRTLFGSVFILHPEENLQAAAKNGYKVVPLEEVVKFCLAHESIYHPALENLDKHYNIGYRKRSLRPYDDNTHNKLECPICMGEKAMRNAKGRVRKETEPTQVKRMPSRELNRIMSILKQHLSELQKKY